MLPRKSRITVPGDFQAIYKKGKRRETPLFIIWVYQRHEGVFRAAVLVSKKFSKRAVARNTVRRRLREILRREIRDRFSGFDMIISLKAQNSMPTSNELKLSLFHALSI